MNQDGIGLGLVICRAIISQNSGKIEVYSKGIDQGTVLIFSMKMQTIPNDEVNEREDVEDGSMSMNDSIDLQLKD